MIVVDTCVVVWLSTEPSKLSQIAVEAIASAAEERDGVAISGVTLYELAWLIRNQRIAVAMSLNAFLARIETRFKVLPVSPAIARLAVELPDSYPGDPMDRMIGATALAFGVALVTPDRVIRRSKAVPVVW